MSTGTVTVLLEGMSLETFRVAVNRLDPRRVLLSSSNQRLHHGIQFRTADSDRDKWLFFTK